METIGQRMSYLMKQKGITNIEMAEVLNIDPSYVAKFKTDARRPNTYQIDRIANKLNVTTDYLLGNEASGLPFYMNVLNQVDRQGINLMTNISSEKHFSVYNEWSTINGLVKDDLLIFQRPNNNDNNTNNKVYLFIYNNEQALIGRLFDNLLYFDNGLPPVDVSDKSKYKAIGKLIRVVRYFN